MYRDEHEERDGSGNWSGNGREGGGENREVGGGEREPGSEDARRRVTRTSNRQPQPQGPTPQRDRRILLRTRAQRREARDRIGRRRGEEAQETPEEF